MGWTVRDRIPVGTRFSARPDRPWGPPSLPFKGHRVFPGGKARPGRVADHSPPSSAAVMEEYSYTSTHPLGHTGPVTRSLYLLYLIFLRPVCDLMLFISWSSHTWTLVGLNNHLRFKEPEILRKIMFCPK